MNGVAEAILEDLLKQAQITNAHLANMLKQGASAGGGGGGAAGGFTKSLGLASIAVGAVSAVFNTLSNVVGYVAGVIGNTAGKMVEFGKAAAEGKAQLSDLFKVFDQLPIIGKLFDLFGQIVQYQEGLLKSYQDLTKSGASFSGSLYDMRIMAYEAYMTLGEFSQVVRENSSLFATAIGGVDAGLKIFAETQRKLVDPNSEMGRSLAGLGVTATEAADMLGTFMRMQGNMSRLSKMGSDSMAESTKGLIVQLDAYSKLTGESREVMEKQLKDRAFDEQKKMFLEALNPTERAQAEAALAAAAQMGGKGLEDEVAVRLMSNNQIKVAGTEAANALRITTRNSSSIAADILAGLKDLKPGSEAAVAAMQGARGSIASGTKQFNDAVGGAGRAGILSFFGAIKFATEQAKTYNQVISEIEGKQLTDEEKREAIFAAQKKQYEGNAAALQAAELRIKMFGAQLGASFLTLIEKFSPAITKISDTLLNLFGKSVETLTGPGGPFEKIGSFVEDYFVPVIQKAVDWFTETFDYLGKADNISMFWSRLGEKIKEGAANIWEYLKPVVDMIKPMLADVFANMMDWIIAALRRNNRIARWLFSETETEKGEKADLQAQQTAARDAQTKIRDLQKQLESAEQQGKLDEVQTLNEQLNEAREELRIAREKISGNPARSRATGSLGMTGNLFEDWGSGTPAILHGTEAVVTPPQMDAIVNNSMASGLETLNMQVAELIRTNKEIADYARRNVDATRSLNGDLFAT